MTTVAKPQTQPPQPPAAKVNRLGLPVAAYQGAESTLCSGCGHDSVTLQLIKAFHELDIQPYNVAKLSGIGCSSKTTAYFMNRSHGFNAVHGRMAAIATGVAMANRKLVSVGVSGDGDTASIGLGHFLHMVRRNVPIVYIIENNGVYGLTKGQFSATADKGSVSKGGGKNEMMPIDCCALAIQMGCDYVARSFSGDFKQLTALIKGAVAHKGCAVIDVISPCITFNNHPGSTKSYKYAKEHEEPIHEVDFIPQYDEIKVDYDPGTTTKVDLPDGSYLLIKKLEREYNPGNRGGALDLLHKASEEKLFLTGLIYHGSNHVPLPDQMGLIDTPLSQLPSSATRPSNEVLTKIMQELM
ncbi:MAG TPA: 2-oxoacid:ferredoxin oxidoreductase subunit beta [Planctomycetota bacterium]|nr:2-oxoacid:ferredoxin oxidoreductase subunit beta [Planctomycetota bacterium]